MKIKRITLILLVLCIVQTAFACSAGIEFLITVSPQYVDLAFFKEFSRFSQKVDDMAYYILNRNLKTALEKYERAYTILFNIYRTYYKNPPPFYTDLEGFKKKMDKLTGIFSSFKEMIENAMFATASEKLKSYVTFTNAFVNPGHDWKPVTEKRKNVLTSLHREDVSYALQSIINQFISIKNDVNVKLGIGEINLTDGEVVDREFFEKFKYTFSPELSKFMTAEAEPISFSELIINDDLRNRISEKTDYIIFGELLTPESVHLEFRDTRKGLVKIEKSDQAFFRYKILSVENLSIEAIDEKKIGIKFDTLYNNMARDKIISRHKLSYSIPSMKFSLPLSGEAGASHDHAKH